MRNIEDATDTTIDGHVVRSVVLLNHIRSLRGRRTISEICVGLEITPTKNAKRRIRDFCRFYGLQFKHGQFRPSRSLPTAASAAATRDAAAKELKNQIRLAKAEAATAPIYKGWR